MQRLLPRANMSSGPALISIFQSSFSLCETKTGFIFVCFVLLCFKPISFLQTSVERENYSWRLLHRTHCQESGAGPALTPSLSYPGLQHLCTGMCSF